MGITSQIVMKITIGQNIYQAAHLIKITDLG